MHNIERMAAKAAKSGVRFRPHCKTHQSAEIGEWFRDAGVTGITVSSVDMAESFARHGWRDITVAFPVNIREIEHIQALARRIALGLLVESVESVQFLRDHLPHPVTLWIKIDSGYHRTGLRPDDMKTIVQVAKAIHDVPHFSFAGLLTHSGQTYHARSQDDIRRTYQEAVSGVKRVQQQLQTEGFARVPVSIGDTPSCSVIEDFSGVDEIRPGNFVFYDVMQWNTGACSEDDLAVAVACPVVAKHAERQEVVIYGGAVHLSKEFIAISDEHGTRTPIYGCVAWPETGGWGPVLNGVYVSRLSQEHGVIQATEQFFEKARIGDLVVVLPVHSCLTVNLLRPYHLLNGTTLA